MRYARCRAMKNITMGILLAVSFLGMGEVFAGPPARPAVISGEVLAGGKPLPEGTVLKFMVGQFEAESGVKVSEEGISYVRIVIPAYDPDLKGTPGGREGDLVKFISLGSYPLSGMPPVYWKRGLNLQKDFIMNQAFKERPVIVSASAVNDGGKWSLKCVVNPVRQKDPDPAPASYKVRWFSVKKRTGGDEKQKVSVFIKEEVLKEVKPGAQSALEYADSTADMRFFRVLLTPVMPDGSVGPTAIREVVPVLTKGGI